jgi:PRTRC genetic system protein C
MDNRVFVYNGTTYQDPGEGFSINDVKAHLTQFFPELAQAVAEEKKLPDGTVQITFVKKAGTKGAEPTAPLTIDDMGRIFNQADEAREAGELVTIAPAVLAELALVAIYGIKMREAKASGIIEGIVSDYFESFAGYPEPEDIALAPDRVQHAVAAILRINGKSFLQALILKAQQAWRADLEAAYYELGGSQCAG